MPSSRLGAWTWLWEGRSALQLPQPCGPAADGAREGLEPQVPKQEGPRGGPPGNTVYFLGFTQAGGAAPSS